MKLGILHQLLRLTKIKTVSDTTDSFLGQKWPIFAPKTAFYADFGKKWGHFYTFWYLKWIKNWHTSSTLKADAGNTVQTLPTLFGAKNDPFLPPPPKKKWVLADFGIIEGIFILFWYPKWMELSILDQLLWLKKIKPVSDTPDSFWGQKWLIFTPPKLHFWHLG